VALLGGPVTAPAWKGKDLLPFFPLVAALAPLLDLGVPLRVATLCGPLLWVDLVVLCVALAWLVRALPRQAARVPGTPIDRLLLALVALIALAALAPERHDRSLADLKGVAAFVAAFYVTAALTSRVRHTRRVWPAFPVVAAILGAQALWATARGAGALAAASRRADGLWHSEHALLNALLIAAPVSLGLALDQGRRSARALSLAAGLAGTAGILCHALRGGITLGQDVFTRLNDPLQFSLTMVVLIVCLSLARFSFHAVRWRPRQSVCWVALGSAFVLLSLLELWWPVLSGSPVRQLVAVGGGVAAGRFRSERALALPLDEPEVELEEAA
jgi:hypothetical protein